MRYGFQCFISDYTYRVGQYCEGNDIGSYTMHTAAEAACSNNVECGCIHDEACDGDRWSISKGYKVRASSTGSCAWTSSKLKQPSHTRRLMYLSQHLKKCNFKVHALLQMNILILNTNIAKALSFNNIQHSKPQKRHV